MKKTLIVLAGLLLPFAAFADVDTYTRDPSGLSISTTTVNFQWITSSVNPAYGGAQLRVVSQAGSSTYGDCIPLAGDGMDAGNENLTLAADTDFTAVMVQYGPAADCHDIGAAQDLLEGDGSEVMFTTPPEVSTTTESTTTPATSDHYKDYLFISGVVIFLLAYPIWGRIFGKPAGV